MKQAMIFAYQDYRSFLKTVWLEKLEANPKFSLRSFAKFLGFSPSNLSEILSGKRSLSADRAHTVSKKLGLNAKENNYFELLVKLGSVKTAALKAEILKEIENFAPKIQVKSLNQESFRVISDWHHLALLVLISLDRFPDLSTTEISTDLKLTPLQIDNAFDRLHRLKLIKPDVKGKWVRTSQDLRIEGKGSSVYLKRYHEQMLKLAEQSIRTQELTDRYSSTDVLVLDEETFAEAKEILNEAMDRIYSLSRKSHKNKLIGFSIHAHTLFPRPKRS